jgi:antitoxin VapB
MSLIIDDPEVEKLARELAQRTGKPVSDAVLLALRRQLLQPGPRRRATVEELRAIAHHCASLPTLDDRTPDEILDYNEDGLWD